MGAGDGAIVALTLPLALSGATGPRPEHVAPENAALTAAIHSKVRFRIGA
jgi:hypothetical protein